MQPTCPKVNALDNLEARRHVSTPSAGSFPRQTEREREMERWTLGVFTRAANANTGMHSRQYLNHSGAGRDK